MTLDINAICHIGNVRQKNEDMIIVGNRLLREASLSCTLNPAPGELPLLVAIADGMGGHKGGAIASEIVVTDMYQAISTLPAGLNINDLRQVMKEKIAAIHHRLNTEGAADSEKTGMGSTFTGLLFYDQCVYLINIGDSRIYRFRDGILSQFSRDHSLSAMTNDPNAPKNILVNSLGAGANLFIDFEDITPRLLNNDLLLLCSDGLNTEVSDHDIENMLSQSADPIYLITAALNNNGSDNVSVATVKYII